MDISFYECAYRCSESACTAILKKIIINEADISVNIIIDVLNRIYTGVQMESYMVSKCLVQFHVVTYLICISIYLSMARFMCMFSLFGTKYDSGRVTCGSI